MVDLCYQYRNLFANRKSNSWFVCAIAVEMRQKKGKQKENHVYQ